MKEIRDFKKIIKNQNKNLIKYLEIKLIYYNAYITGERNQVIANGVIISLSNKIFCKIDNEPDEQFKNIINVILEDVGVQSKIIYIMPQFYSYI